MGRRHRLVTVFVSSLLAISASAHEAGADSPGTVSGIGIGYPTVAAALADLRSRDDVTISQGNGWTIVEDRAAGVVWSFTPPDHPAYPAAVKRMVTERDGAIFIEMRTLCQAEKSPCDRLVAEFEALNRETSTASREGSEAASPRWTPSERQKSLAERTLFVFLEAADNGRYREAYQLFAAGMKDLMTFEEFRSHEELFRAAAGGEPARSDIRATWYNDPPGAAAPGVYAAFDITCRYRNISECTEVVVLHELENGEFRVMRHERNYVGKENGARQRKR